MRLQHTLYWPSLFLAAILTIAVLMFPLAGDGLAQRSGQNQISIHAPFWRLGGGYSTSIAVNNSQPRPIEVQPLVLYPKDGGFPVVPHQPVESRVSLSGLGAKF